MGINNQEHEDRNALGFEGDTIMRDKIRSIIENNGIKTVVETGTYKGATTRWLAQWADKVYTFESNEANFDIAKSTLSGCDNVCMSNIDSVDGLQTLDEHGLLNSKEKVFFFLDAHWQENNPLLDELKVISEMNIIPFISIHDFKVPDSDLGFDSYNGQDYEWSWIVKSIEKIYGKDGYTIEYNSAAIGARQGIIYLYPKQ